MKSAHKFHITTHVGEKTLDGISYNVEVSKIDGDVNKLVVDGAITVLEFNATEESYKQLHDLLYSVGKQLSRLARVNIEAVPFKCHRAHTLQAYLEEFISNIIDNEFNVDVEEDGWITHYVNKIFANAGTTWVANVNSPTRCSVIKITNVSRYPIVQCDRVDEVLVPSDWLNFDHVQLHFPLFE